MYKISTTISNRELVIETGRLARQADGAVTVMYGGTVVLVTAVMSDEIKEGQDFFPLTVDYRERTYAAGKIPGGFIKREGRPSDAEILSSRLIDRPIRPLFPEGLSNEVQVVATVLSSDTENDPDVLGILGASAAVSVSDIPFWGPIGAVRIGYIDGKFVINPTLTQLQQSGLDLVMAGTTEGINMIEAAAREVDQKIFIDALTLGYEYIQQLVEFQKKLVEEVAKPKREVTLKQVDQLLYQKVKERSLQKLQKVKGVSRKEQREEIVDLICHDLIQELGPGTEDNYSESDIRAALYKVEKEEMRRVVLEENLRVDGRNFTEIRPVSCEVGVLPRTHGSALFTRGQTQSLAVTTLGTSADEQMIDALEGESFKKFMLHYNFPPFSVGEVRPMRGPGRREIGHGALAERALSAVMPSEDEFPYTVRIVSDILESNGSSSMATVCGASLALMDAGVPIKRAVSGIAMGLVKEGEKIAILTDITGLEDHFGDMDFKITGTTEGITALQMDVKNTGINVDIIQKIMEQSKAARFFVLDKMNSELKRPRPSLSIYAPRITTLQINPEKIKDLIGPGGKTIKKIIAETGAEINIEDDGKVLVASNKEEASKRAIEMIKAVTEEVEVGKVYMGKVKNITSFGAFLEILPGQEGMVHVSELSDHYVKNVEDEVKVGDEFLVKVIGIDPMGRIKLSRKQVGKR